MENTPHIDTDLSAALKPFFEKPYAEYLQQAEEACRHPLFLQTVSRVFACSDFAAKIVLRGTGVLQDLFASGIMASSCVRVDYVTELTTLLQEVTSEDALCKALRLFRQKHMLRIVWRDLAQWSSVENTLAELSYLADACIETALECLYRLHSQRDGMPCDPSGEPQQLFVIALGKLGGNELNFSSDIDIMCCYANEGQTQGGSRVLDNRVFFSRLVQSLVKSLNLITEDGFVFRVDLRLRPYGSDGPVVMNFHAMEVYYQEQGRDWERYALLKARVVNQHPQAIPFIALFRRFVYRRYIDYGVIAALRDVKQLMKQDATRGDTQNDLKRGWGGIREIEFIVQSLQIIHGGKHPQLQSNQLLPAIKKLQQLHYLEPATAQSLRDAYLFLRRLENCLQMVADEQTHALPKKPLAQERLAYAMALSQGRSALLHRLQHYRHRVHQIYHDSTMPAQQLTQMQQRWQTQIDVFQSLWFGQFEPPAVEALLNQIGIKQSQAIASLLQRLRETYEVKQSAVIAQQRLAKVLPLVLIEIIPYKNMIDTFERVIALLKAIIRRSAYLVLLLENPKTLQRLLQLCSKSVWIAEQIAQYPMLLDELLDSNWLSSVMDSQAIENEWQRVRLDSQQDDIEQFMELLRQFRLANMLRIAAIDVLGYCPVSAVGIYLTHLATVILNRVADVAYRESVEQYGCPVDATGAELKDAFAIIAYGSFASWELGYGSDLDVVFLHSGEEGGQTNGKRVVTHHQFYMRVAQKMIHMLNIRTANGLLYQIDIRLRPSGSAGLLVSSIDAFATYQYRQAWLWEHQALIKARVVFGKGRLRQRFEAIRKNSLARHRDKKILKKQIVRMRERVAANQPSVPQQRMDIKYSRGGMIDLEFMIQYLVLLHANDCPALLVSTDNAKILGQLAAMRHLTWSDAHKMVEVCHYYRHIMNRAVLEQRPLQVKLSEVHPYCQWVQRLWHTLFVA